MGQHYNKSQSWSYETKRNSSTQFRPYLDIKIERIKVKIEKKPVKIDERSSSVLKFQTPHFRYVLIIYNLLKIFKYLFY